MNDGFDGSGPSRPVRLVAIAAGLVIAALVVLLAVSPGQQTSQINTAAVGQVAPLTAGIAIDGSDVDLRDFRGRWVVVNFFATWCAGCRVEHPELVEFSRRHGELGDAAVLGVVWDDQVDQVASFFAEEGGDWPVIASDNGAIGLSYGVTAVPESYLISPTGRVLQKFVGASGVTADNLDASIEALTARAAAVDQSGSSDDG